MKGSDALMEMLRAEGVKYIFGNPGTSEAPILDAMEAYPDFEYVLAVQESVAIGMADTYARATGTPAFVSLHIDNGLSNSFALLIDSYNTGTPLVVTAGNKDVRKLTEGRSDLAEMARPYAKWSAEITHPEQYPSAIRRAFNEAASPPTGPVFLSLSANSLDDEADIDIVPSRRFTKSPNADPKDIEDAVELLARAENPILLVGDRVMETGGTAAAVRVAEQLGAAVYGYLSTQVNFPTGHPQYMGPMTVRHSAAVETLNNADVVLAAGCPVFSEFFYKGDTVLGPQTKLVHIDINANEIGKSEPTDVGVFASPGAALAQLAEALESEMTGSQIEAARGRAEAVAAKTRAADEAFRSTAPSGGSRRPMSPESAMLALSEALPDNAVVFDDSVSNRASLQAAAKFNEPGDFFSARGNSIGWGPGGGLGLKLANPDRPVVAVCGDGSAMMSVQGLWTAVNSNIPTVFVMCNNAMYRILKLNMNIYKNDIQGRPDEPSKYMAMDFPVPFDFAALGRAFGMHGVRIEDPSEIGPELNKAIEMNAPAVLDVVMDGAI
jgi:benzoylformate decarboxylase